jgi:Holliday junction resolvase-like predicted endonuclease
MSIVKITGNNMDYKKFEHIFNKTIFEKSKPDLIRKIATYPERYAGLFRPTKPKAKIIQNLLQSHEIRFGDAFETLIEKYLQENDFNILNKRFADNDGTLELDQMFSNENTIFFVEQKVRDDHDSSKKRGQIDNFEKKISVILETYKEKKVIGFFYFIDDSFTKNKKFYTTEIQRLSADYGLELHLSYGDNLFDKLNKIEIWDEILKHLKTWKNNIPDLPEINFDKNPQASFEEIKYLKPLVYRKLFSNPNLDSLLCVLFPEKLTLNLLNKYFEEMYQNNEGTIYKTLNELCTATISRIA